jgi:hypothetical protein
MTLDRWHLWRHLRIQLNKRIVSVNGTTLLVTDLNRLAPLLAQPKRGALAQRTRSNGTGRIITSCLDHRHLVTVSRIRSRLREPRITGAENVWESKKKGVYGQGTDCLV